MTIKNLVVLSIFFVFINADLKESEQNDKK